MAYQPNYMNPGYYMYGANGVNNNMQQPAQRYQPPMEQQYIQPQPIYKQPIGLQGKTVDSIDVVKATDIPLDGSTCYFPLIDGSAIVTKKLQTDGTSKTVLYKPVDNGDEKGIQYATLSDIDKAINNIDLSDLEDIKDDIKDLKQSIKELKKKKKED